MLCIRVHFTYPITDDIRMRFFEESKNFVWEAYGKFSTADVHKQVWRKYFNFWMQNISIQSFEFRMLVLLIVCVKYVLNFLNECLFISSYFLEILYYMSLDIRLDCDTELLVQIFIPHSVLGET